MYLILSSVKEFGLLFYMRLGDRLYKSKQYQQLMTWPYLSDYQYHRSTQTLFSLETQSWKDRTCPTNRSNTVPLTKKNPECKHPIQIYFHIHHQTCKLHTTAQKELHQAYNQICFFLFKMQQLFCSNKLPKCFQLSLLLS